MERLPRPCCDPPTSGSPCSLPPRLGQHPLDRVFEVVAEACAHTRGGKDRGDQPPRWRPTPTRRDGSIAVSAGRLRQAVGSLPGHPDSPVSTSLSTRPVTSVRRRKSRLRARSLRDHPFRRTASPYRSRGPPPFSLVDETIRRVWPTRPGCSAPSPRSTTAQNREWRGHHRRPRHSGPDSGVAPTATSSSCSPTVRRAPTPRASATPDRHASATSGLRCECRSRRRRDGGA